MASRDGLPSKQPASVGAPNQTLYCWNLPDKLRKPDLRLSLYTLFASYGPVLDVVALKTEKMRGQAHIVFRDVQTSTQAMRALQGFDFFGKEMKIAYGRGKSDTVAKLDGTYKMPTAAQTSTAPTTELQQSIFNAPPSSIAADTVRPPAAKTLAPTTQPKDAPSPAVSAQGVKRPREEDESDEEAPMEEDDSDAPMEDSSDED